MEENLDYKELIVRFLEKNLNEDEFSLLNTWINDSYQNRKLFDQYNEIWQKSSVFFNEGHYNSEINAGFIKLKKDPLGEDFT